MPKCELVTSFLACRKFHKTTNPRGNWLQVFSFTRKYFLGNYPKQDKLFLHNYLTTSRLRISIVQKFMRNITSAEWRRTSSKICQPHISTLVHSHLLSPRVLFAASWEAEAVDTCIMCLLKFPTEKPFISIPIWDPFVSGWWRLTGTDWHRGTVHYCIILKQHSTTEP